MRARQRVSLPILLAISIVIIAVILIVSTFTFHNINSETSSFVKGISQKVNFETLAPIRPIPTETLPEDKTIPEKNSIEISRPTLPPINQFTRFPPPVTFQTPGLNSTTKGTDVLVVGGTDGSGTRRVVQILAALGVTMVSEDPETFDIHGDLMGGWPTVVTPVLKVAKRLDYDPDALPESLVRAVDSSLKQLINQARQNAHAPQSFKLGRGGALPHGSGVAANIEFGFKAPVSMTLVPWWLRSLPRFRFLHVLRDGRDIAFSANQGPVNKFYESMYSSDADRQLSPPAKGVKLWSDWNSQIFNWAKKTASMPKLQSQKEFDYFMLHSEDLVNENVAVRFAAISHLAVWVGSSLSDDQTCCLAVLDSGFMGSHDRTDRSEVKDSQVTSRYGKWKKRVAGQPALEAALLLHGGEGLRLFGYEPLREQAKADQRSASGYQCTLTPEQCGAPPPFQLEKTAAKLLPGGQCQVWAGVDFKGSDLIFSTIEASESNEQTDQCCNRCFANANCMAFTVDFGSGVCYLKSSKGTVLPSRSSLSSGVVLSRQPKM